MEQEIKGREKRGPLKSASLTLAIDALKGSVNRILMPSRHDPKKWVYSGGYRKQKEKMVLELEVNHSKFRDFFSGFDTGHYVVFDIEFVDHWLTKNSNYRKFRKKDVTNYVKNIEDVVSKFMGFDDSMISVTVLRKVCLPPGSDRKSLLRMNLELHEMNFDF